ncbi:MAG: hypothetical protein ACREUW_03750 [Burkholderiales bacterium]
MSSAKRFIFARSLRAPGPGSHWVTCGAARDANPRSGNGAAEVDLAEIFRTRGREWGTRLIESLGELNRRNASPAWWAHASTAKNLLSSDLGDRLLELMALTEIADRQEVTELHVLGATRGQIEAFTAWARARGYECRFASPGLREWCADHVAAPLRLAGQVLRLLVAFRTGTWRAPAPAAVDVCLFTYFDAPLRTGFDTYFGPLREMIRAASPLRRVHYLSYIPPPYRTRLRRLRSLAEEYSPLFAQLTATDMLKAYADARRAQSLARFDLEVAIDSVPIGPVVAQALREDVWDRGLLHHLLILRAATVFFTRHQPALLVYPYENKSLEKLLLSAVREASPGTSVCGYQHSSITPRHLTLLFAPGEAAATPLPDRIVTAGTVTRDYLAQHGHYPSGLLVAGCALRQRWRDAPPKTAPGTPPRVLLALSSSVTELVRAVSWWHAAMSAGLAVELAVRPHPEFPLGHLPAALRDWVRTAARDLSGTPLADNLDWCDVVAYVSSTVGLEGLSAGRAVLHLDIGDPIDPDPLIGEPPFRWQAAQASGLASALADMAALSRETWARQAAAAREYARNYLRPPTPDCVAAFLDTPAPGARHG